MSESSDAATLKLACTGIDEVRDGKQGLSNDAAEMAKRWLKRAGAKVSDD